ncbi:MULTISPECIES: FecR domain-containing protein [unclassified Leptolyngbya]|uniref:FecR domain-containing protein n=1 Tax=unclassified Leptolyngbya TaxID=2650499 RepID=UPI001689F05B|nr:MULTISPECIES: FecR domain-containing protein [unclassified Leptolyngbya]MBD1909701.1 FecR domain-containing protein [Leptolyngbya sp. FACHB-8]MBD2155967.1 FecR domain-containing protein [Leptolyngbya sp. FACHB-16]
MIQFFMARLTLRPLRPWLIGLVFGFAIVLGIGSWNSPGTAQTVSAGTIAEVLDGSEVFIQNNQARVGDTANRGQNVRTGSARAQVNFNTGAVARLSSNSSLTVGQCAQLQRGVLLVNGAVNGCTGSVTAGVRGTTYLMEVDDDGREQVKVLEGEVTVTKNESGGIVTSPDSTAPEATSDEPESVVLKAGEKVSTQEGDRLSDIEQITADEFQDILLGELFDGFLQLLPGLSRIQSSFQQLYPNIPFPLDSSGLPIPGPSIPSTPSIPGFPF